MTFLVVPVEDNKTSTPIKGQSCPRKSITFNVSGDTDESNDGSVANTVGNGERSKHGPEGKSCPASHDKETANKHGQATTSGDAKELKSGDAPKVTNDDGDMAKALLKQLDENVKSRVSKVNSDGIRKEVKSGDVVEDDGAPAALKQNEENTKSGVSKIDSDKNKDDEALSKKDPRIAQAAHLLSFPGWQNLD